MIDPKKLEEMARQFTAKLPESLKHYRQELDKLFKATLEATLAKMHLVTREEFDRQVKLLEQSRQELAELRKKTS